MAKISHSNPALDDVLGQDSGSEAAALCERFLKAKGTCLRNYMPASQAELIAVARDFITEYSIEKKAYEKLKSDRDALLESAKKLHSLIVSLEGESSCIDEDIMNGDVWEEFNGAISGSEAV